MMSSRKTSQTLTNYGPVHSTVKFKEEAGLSVYLLFQEGLDGPLLTMCINQSIMHLGWDKTLEKLYEYY